MKIDKNDVLNSILNNLSKIDYIKPGDIPNIPLYMDQVTTFMDAQLESTKRFEEDKILTKTMINNYAKSDLLPPPLKKKYSKEHLLLLIFIYYFKNFLTIMDLQCILKPITDRFFNTDGKFSLEQIYTEVFEMEHEQVEILKTEISNAYQRSSETFQDAPKEDQEFLNIFSFICILSFDVYVKKQIIESLIDQFNPTSEAATKSEKQKK